MRGCCRWRRSAHVVVVVVGAVVLLSAVFQISLTPWRRPLFSALHMEKASAEEKKDGPAQQAENAKDGGVTSNNTVSKKITAVHTLNRLTSKPKIPAAPGNASSFPASAAELFSSRNVTGESPAQLEDLYQRAASVDRECSKHHNRLGKVLGIFTHDASRVAYCFLPKVGCTFWKRVFSYLNHFTGGTARSPWDIPRLKVHNNDHAHGQAWTRELQLKSQNYMRFMFVRHPYSRLWSAYVDKFLLPDFWLPIGVQAVHRFRLRPSRKAQLCGHDLKFSEFVKFSLGNGEPHWDPIYLRCDPCLFRPAVVGSLESFAADSLFVLRRMGLEWVLKGVDRQEQVENELSTLVRYNFELTASKAAYKPCINSTLLIGRLWEAFQINGYIPDDQRLPSPPAGQNVTPSWFERQVLHAFRAALPRKKELKQQKREHLRQALKSLSPELKAKLRIKYMPDMLYFGYNDSNY